MDDGLTLREMVRQFKEDWPMRNTDPDTDTGSPTNSVIKRCLNQAQRMIHQTISQLGRRVAVVKRVDYPADTDHVLMDGITKVESVTGRPAGTTGEPLPIQARSHQEVVTAAGGGGGRMVAAMGNKLFLRPRPQEAWELYIWHTGKPPDLVTPDDIPRWLLPAHHDLIVAKAIQLRRGTVGDPTGTIDSIVGQLESRLMLDYESLMPDNGVQETNDEGFYDG